MAAGTGKTLRDNGRSVAPAGRAYPSDGPVMLRSLLADNPSTRSMKAGLVGAPLLQFDFDKVEPVFDGFKPMIREGRYDFGELAIVTYLQARAAGKPVVLLPAVIGARFQHHCICYDSSRGTMRPADLVGKRVAVRSYTQTTGVWVRGILQQDYGVDPASVTWVVFEESHLAEFADPGNVVYAGSDQTPLSMLLAGEVDAALLGSDMPEDPRLQPLIADPKAAARAWHAQTDVVPMNHMAVVHADLAAQRPDVVHALYNALRASRDADTPATGLQMRGFGISALRSSLELAIDFTLAQGVIPRRLSVDELFEEASRLME